MHNLVHGYQILLASNFALYAKTHANHFNVTGPFFSSFHKLFKTQYEDLQDAHDAIGENIRKLDAFAPTGLLDLVKCSVIPEETAVVGAMEMVDRLCRDHNRMIMLLNRVFKLAEAENRQDHMNFIAERLDAHSKMRWMLKATSESIATQNKSVDAIIKL